jgi:hypothetical protein
MFKRRRFKQIFSLSERLTENVERLREQLTVHRMGRTAISS